RGLLVDDVHGGFLGRGSRAVDADVAGDQPALLVLVRSFAGRDKAAGADVAHLVVQGLSLAVRPVPDVVAVRGRDVREFLGEAFVQGLAVVSFGRGHAHVLYRPGPLRR